MAAEQVCIITSAGVRKCFDVTTMQQRVAQYPTQEPVDESIGQLMNQRTIFDEIGDGQTLFGKLVRSFLPKTEPAPAPAAAPDRPAAPAAQPPQAG